MLFIIDRSSKSEPATYRVELADVGLCDPLVQICKLKTYLPSTSCGIEREKELLADVGYCLGLSTWRTLHSQQDRDRALFRDAEHTEGHQSSGRA